ncbi:MAG: DUF4365 domain-containing protein [Calothrix sp. FI2-JRJ7]|jgi:hypothetical protein|nr:DUF4365 domain-containing protein [Calothrix sp. FI2-JRJ7]
MSLNTQKEDFSYAYIYTIASSMGYCLQAATRRLDDSGIDATITVPGKINTTIRELRIDLESLCLKRCAYWLSLRGRPPLEKQTTITVEIPRQNIFSPNALKTIMERIAAGENL